MRGQRPGPSRTLGRKQYAMLAVGVVCYAAGAVLTLVVLLAVVAPDGGGVEPSAVTTGRLALLVLALALFGAGGVLTYYGRQGAGREESVLPPEFRR